MARYLSPLDVWGVAFGCSVGWGAFVMPATTFLPMAGPAGTLVAMLMGTSLMLIIGHNYAWLMRKRPRKGGVYAYIKEAFGRDHAFLCSWFLSLSYLTVVFLNATALFIISRIVFDDFPQIGFKYRIGDHVIYPGEIALSVFVLVAVGVLLIRRKPFMQAVQRILALILLFGAVILTAVSIPHFHWGELLHSFGTGGFGDLVRGAGTAADAAGTPGAVSVVTQTPGLRSFGAVLTIVLLAPWAFVGFDVVALETPHFDFPLRRSGRVMMCAILSAGFVYTAMTFVSASFMPAAYSSWQAYIGEIDRLEGVSGVPVFFAAETMLGTAGLVLVTVTALAAILTGVIGAYRATVRMLSTMAEDRILSREFNGTTFSIIFIMAVSSVFTFLGRNTLNWFVELTSFGATVGFAYASAAAARIASKEGSPSVRVTGILGAVVSGLFALVQLASKIASVETMGAPAFLLLAVWCLLGFVFYWRTMRQSELSDFEGVTTSSAVLFCLLFYSVLMWFLKRIEDSAESLGLKPGGSGVMTVLRRAILTNGAVMMLFVVVGLFVMLLTQGWLRKRQALLEREKIQAEESNKAKSQFLFNMSHDIRTPMNAIIGYTHLAGLESDVPPRVREYIEKIDISGRHLLTLINDVLEMSRIESGKMELESEPGDICEALQTAFEMFRSQMEEKKITFVLDIREVAAPYVVFDRNRFLRVILNLVSNAYKFTPEGGHVSVSMTQIGTEEGAEAVRLYRAGSAGTEGSRDGTEPAGNGLTEKGFIGKRLNRNGLTEKKAQAADTAGADLSEVPVYGVYELRVKDDGIGMTKEFAATVFEAFARERTSTVSRIQGTGLGMAITKSIVDAMQGSIDVETAPGEGTEFIIRVPYPLCGAEEVHVWKAGDASQVREQYPDLQTPSRPADRDAAQLPEQQEQKGREEQKDQGSGAETAAEGPARAKRLLVAEDMEINRQILGMLLENLGYEIDMAEDGSRAVEKVSAAAPGFYDAVLMDIQMPVMDGYEATQKIRDLDEPALADIPIIAVTANAFGEDVRRAHEAGMDAHISKPIDPDQLARTLETVLG